MAHRALTLKYRPQVFADVVGQDHVTAVLTRALENHRIAHAYLFTGARGVGKTTAARILAKALNCEKRPRPGDTPAKGKGAKARGNGFDPCNECTSCTEITAGMSLDVAEIDGASNRGIADVQALREKVRFSPTGGRYRVVIIDEVHQLSNDAFAALLKTLEEPPPHLVFIFATTDPQKLPETIRSRTQRFDFARVPIRRVADRLLDIAAKEAKDPEGLRFELSEGAAMLIAHKSEGSLRDAVSALDQVVTAGEPEVDEELVRRVLGLADREAFFAIGDAIVKHDPKVALRALHDAFDKGLDARDLAEGLTAHIRHILILKVDPDGADLVVASREDLDRLRAQGEGWSESDLLRLLRIASETSWPMRDSPQPIFHLEAAVMQMATLDPGETLAEILARIEALEKRLGGGGGGGRAAASGGRSGGAATRRTASATSASVATRAAPAAPGARTTPAWQAPGAGGAARAIGDRPLPRPPANAGPREVTASAAPARPAHVPTATTPALAPSAPASPRPVVARADATHAVANAAGDPQSATAVVDPPEAALELDAQVWACWRQAVQAINGRKRMLGAFLEESQFMGRAGDVLVIGTDDLHRSVIEDHAHLALIAEAAERTFGCSMNVRCVPASDTPPPRFDEPAQAPVTEDTPLAPAPEESGARPSNGHGQETTTTNTPQERRSSESDLQSLVERAIEWFDGETFSPERAAKRGSRPS